ncbi:hypothetical protein [Chamaesiphon sp. OTE_20_metabat_361]|uniref:hypothetical protein n=1 Tax=Chamaesiphon sp. OTE_20_metabat_361 TaxID=2964689 RepID=UPI00286D1FF6|nr:hypothetical protein [Chamaesiphon sp. OTE_20_metabat_361]
MKQIQISMLVLCLGCGLPLAARAEAPTPKSGCWSTEVAIRPSTPEQVTTATGRVIGIERSNKDRSLAATEVVTWVKLKTPTGQKTVYLGSDRSLQQQGLKLKVRDTIEVQGVQTYKSKKLPTIIANTVKKSDRVWKIDNIATKPTSDERCRFNG